MRLPIGTVRRTWALAQWLAILLTAGCLAPAEDQERNVEAPNESPSQGTCSESLAPPEFQLERQFCIDGMAEALVHIDDVAVASDGTLAVVQRGSHSVRLYDSDGRFLRAIGGRGEGPGEYRNAVLAGWANGRLWVWDSDLYRFSYFNVDGSLDTITSIHHVSQLDAQGSFLPNPIGMSADGQVVLRQSASILANSEPAPGQGERVAAFLASQDGVIRHRIAEFPPRDLGRAEDGSGSAIAVPPFPNEVVWGLSPDGTRIVAVDARPGSVPPGEMSIRAISTTGDTLFELTWPIETFPIPKQRRSEALERMRERARSASNPLVAEALRRAARVPEHYPPARELVVGMDGSAWVRGTLRERGYLVFDPQGQPLGRAIIPANRSILAAQGDTIWVVEFSQWDVESVSKYRVLEFAGRN